MRFHQLSNPEGKHDDKKVIFVVFSACQFSNSLFSIFKDLTMNNNIILKTSPSDQELNDNSMLCVSD